jgi:hypothetical protein
VSVLRAIESKIEGLVEGVFGRAFRTHVQPVELARKLAKEMDEHRSVSVSRVYVPNEYTLYLAPGDREQFLSYEGSLLGELQEYLSEHARREGYSLLSSPRVLITSDDDLAIGEFGIATRVVQPGATDGAGAEPLLPAPPEPSLEDGLAGPVLPNEDAVAAIVVSEVPAATVIYRPTAPVEPDPEPEEEPPPPARETVTLTIGDRVYPVTVGRVVLGRSRECDIRVADANASRRHCEIVQDGPTSWSVVDLDSTNGTELNGHRIHRSALTDGDRVTVGGTDVVFGRTLQ